MLLEPGEGGVLVGYAAHDDRDGNGVVLERYALEDGERTGRARLAGVGWATSHVARGRHVMAFRLGTVRLLDAVTLVDAIPPIAFGPDPREALRRHYGAPGPLPPPPTDLEGTREHDRAFSMLGLIAERVVDLEHERTR